MKTISRVALAVLAAALIVAAVPKPASAAALDVTRATLKNGLQVIVVNNPLAPVATAALYYKVGGDEQQFPGQAHALEHMMFRGTPDISQTQLFGIGQLLGGDYDADTQGEVTRYYFTVPSQYLDVALRLEADRARSLSLAQSGWLAERGAIEQEVTQDDSNALSKLLIRTVLPSIFKGTPYANDVLGTLDSFNNKVNAKTIRQLYAAWYHPNNAVYVISGNVDGTATVKMVEKYFGSIPAATLPSRRPVVMQPLKAATYHVDSDQPYSIVAVAYRLPGWSDKDYAASEILQAVLNNQRADLYGLTAAGKTLFSGFLSIESHPHAAAAVAAAAVPITSKAETAADELNGVIDGYRKSGVPADLVEVEKQRAIASAEFQGNSSDGLAFEWGDAVAKQNYSSPAQEINAIRKVSADDVNRVLRTYLVPQHSLTIFAVPKNLGKINSGGGGGPAKENNVITPEKPQPMPQWAQAAFAHVQVPQSTTHPVDVTLSNGARLIVLPEHITHTVVVHGRISSDEAVQAPADKLGVGDMVAGLFSFGTTTYDRIALRRQLDAIAADATAGTDFSLSVLSDKFDRGVQLLADEELHPAFPDQAFQIVKQQSVGGLAGEITAPAHLTDVALNKALFPMDDPLQKFATPTTASAVTLDDVKTYFTNVYRPDMTTIVVIGDVTPDQAKATFEKYFGAWSATGPKPDVTLPAVPKNAASQAEVPDNGRVQSEVQLAQVLGLGRADDGWAAMTVANAILGGGGFGSYMMDDLRVKHGYVYGASSSLQSYTKRSVFTINYACDPDKIVPAQQLALTDLKAMESGYIPADRLQRSKTLLISNIPLRETSYDSVANEFLNDANFGLPLDQATIDARRELAVNAHDVSSALSKWIDPGTFVRIVTGPGPK